jgi:hypothetical protein
MYVGARNFFVFLQFLLPSEEALAKSITVSSRTLISLFSSNAFLPVSANWICLTSMAFREGCSIGLFTALCLLCGMSFWSTFPGSLRLLSSGLVAEYLHNGARDSKSSANGQTQTQLHVVFVGDSTSRYQFLTLAHLLHFQTRVPQELVVGLGMTWPAFFNATTNHFDGAMSCDCYRPPKGRWCNARFGICDYIGHFGEIIHENRQYLHPSRQLVLTYISSMGDWPIHGFTDFDKLHEGRISTVPRPYRWKVSVLRLLQQSIFRLQPRATHVIMNCGLWRHPRILSSIDEIILALSNAAPVAVWRETSPIRGQLRGPRRPVDEAARSLCRPIGKRTCSYFPFPNISDLNQKDYWDRLHLKARVNELWAKELWRTLLMLSSNVSWISSMFSLSNIGISTAPVTRTPLPSMGP